jgi:hypothetical protein
VRIILRRPAVRPGERLPLAGPRELWIRAADG